MIVKISIKHLIQILVKISSQVYLEKLKVDLKKLVDTYEHDLVKLEEEFDAYLMRHHWLESVRYAEVNL